MRRALVLALLLLLAARPAGAHGDTGTMTVTAAEQLDGLQVRLEVGVLHEDGDLAEEATVTAVLQGPDGASVGPVQLARISGARYGAEVFLPVPGTWTAAITATGPAAEASATIEVPAAPVATTTSTVAATTTTTEPEDDGGGSSTTGWVLAGLAAAGSVLAFSSSRRRGRA